MKMFRPGFLPVLTYMKEHENGEKNEFMTDLMNRMPMLREKYVPPALWGTSGHLQTGHHAMVDKRPGVQYDKIKSRRLRTDLHDGSVVSYDIFDPDSEPTHSLPGGDVTMVVCPGLADCSERGYLQAFAAYASNRGYRVVVLNLLGSLEDEELKTPRIFDFGSTEEYAAVVSCVKRDFPSTKLVAVGFSLGGNTVCKYLGENADNESGFIACASLCQGYDFMEIRHTMDTWRGMRKFYVRMLTDELKEIILQHYDILSKSADGERLFSKRDVENCTYLIELDELVTLKITNHKTVEDYYRSSSSSQHLSNIRIPTLYVNAQDDPLFSKSLYEHPKAKALSHDKSIFVMNPHGGHLAFFTKTGSTRVDPVTWLDRIAVQFADAVSSMESSSQ